MVFARLQMVVAVGAMMLLAGCSMSGLPDWANPGEWFDDEQPVSTEDAPSERPGPVDVGAPSLSSVPQRPQPISTPAERRANYNSISGIGYDDQNVYAEPDHVVNGPATSALPTVINQSLLPTQAPDATLLPSMVGRPLGAMQPLPVNNSGLGAGTAENFQASRAEPLSDAVLSYIPVVEIEDNQATGTLQPLASVNGNLPIATIFFASGSVLLNEDDRAKIGDAARQQTANSKRVLIVGHASADAVTDDAVNFEISKARAQAVADALVVEGVDPSLIVVEARGSSVTGNLQGSPAAEASGRRVEIYLD